MNDDLSVDQRTLARIFGVHQRTVQRWEDEGLDVARIEGAATYDLPAAVAWFAARGEDRNGSEGSGLVEAKTRKATVDALLREDELAARRGELVPMERVLTMVREPLEKVDVQLRTAVRRHSKAWADRLGVSQAEAMAMMHEIVEEVRGELREAFEG